MVNKLLVCWRLNPRHKLQHFFYAFLIIVVSASANFARASNDPPLKSITVQLKWKHQFQFAGFYAAVEKGFYKEAGFDVSLKAADVITNPIDEVLSGRADYGLANSELALYRLQGKPVMALAVIIQHSPIVLMTLKESGIYSPQDLIGKRVMHPEGLYGANTVGTMLREGVTRDQFESVPLSFNINDLIDGKVDAMVGYVTDQPFILKERGIEYNLLDPRSYGIDFYGDTLFTTEENVKTNTEEVERFRQATLKGWRYAVEHPQEIIELILAKYQTEKTRQELAYEADETIKLIVPKLVEIGHINPGRWTHIAKTFHQLGLVGDNLSLDGFIYLPEELEKQKLQRALLKRVSVGVAVVLFFLVVLLLFNQRLRKVVAQKTADLKALNKDLENRVKQRTASLNEANELLSQEIQFRKQKELSLKLLHEAIENSSSAVVVLDRDLKVLHASAGVYLLTGIEANELVGNSFRVLSRKIKVPDLSLEDILRGAEFETFSNVRSESKTGVEHWLQVAVSPMKIGSDDITHYVVAFEDVSELKESRDKLETMALYDSLTGLDNRLLFNIRLEKAIHRAQRSNVKTALLFIDIDNFKTINDTIGHDAGDKVLQAVAERLKSHVRDNDPIARISGDEFTVLLTDIRNYGDAGKITSKLIDAFSEPVRVGSQEIFVTTSIGVSVTPDDALEMDQLMKNADLAMYQAKQSGRNNFRFFSPDMNQVVKQKSLIESEIKLALKDDNFFLLYQPQICLKTNRLIGVEALVRWHYSDDEIRMPGDFIGVAEDTGLITELGYCVARKAIQGMVKMKQLGLDDFKMAINVAARQIRETNFVDQLSQLFDATPELVPHFELEITESSFIDNNSENIAQLERLRELGFVISIDDFGTGYSSLSYLQRLPLDVIKIDRSFVIGLPDQKNSVEICRAIIAMAKNLNLKVVAEGIETMAQDAFFKDGDCDIAQGYFYGKPMPLEEIVSRFAVAETQ